MSKYIAPNKSKFIAYLFILLFTITYNTTGETSLSGKPESYKNKVLGYYYSIALKPYQSSKDKGETQGQFLSPQKDKNQMLGTQISQSEYKILGSHPTEQIRVIQTAIKILKNNSSLRLVEDRAIMGLLYTFYSHFFTGSTRSYYLSLGILLINQSIKEEPRNIRLRFIRLLAFKKLPSKFYNVQSYITTDRNFLLSSISQNGIKKTDQQLSYLYHDKWEKLLSDNINTDTDTER